ncbi:alpha-crystallin A chain [Platysternon megacephalum]|uniref:Alpha-crystallin A chain n=1 Tax=Platysternon megacephalum TaxID=55544 RepID=A0A4D9E8A3_9SAUR|nr:alpha-crystallin A chain [Platysternon megacephalum]
MEGVVSPSPPSLPHLAPGDQMVSASLSSPPLRAGSITRCSAASCVVGGCGDFIMETLGAESLRLEAAQGISAEPMWLGEAPPKRTVWACGCRAASRSARSWGAFPGSGRVRQPAPGRAQNHPLPTQPGGVVLKGQLPVWQRNPRQRPPRHPLVPHAHEPGAAQPGTRAALWGAGSW